MKTFLSLACFYNRKAKTIESLSSIIDSSKNSNNFYISPFLVDDNSSDGTTNEIKKMYNEVTIFKTSGNYFWAKSMNYGVQRTINLDFDYYIFYNDDVIFLPNSIEKAINYVLDNDDRNSLYIFSTIDKDNNISYGGLQRKPGINKCIFQLIPPNNNNKVQADTMNMNFVIVSKKIIKKLGFFPQHFRHHAADFYLGEKLKRNKINLVVAPGLYGICDRNKVKNDWLEKDLSLLNRYRIFNHPKNYPFYSMLRYNLYMSGFAGLYFFFLPFLKILLFHFNQKWK